MGDAEPSLRLERFDKSRHDRARFDCGVAALNEYLRTKLGQHSRKDVTRGYVLATDDGTIAGYFTLAAGRLMVGIAPGGHGFPPRVPLPTILLGRLAVDKDFRGRGLGQSLLIFALRKAAETAEQIGAALVEVDAKDEAVRAFYAEYGFESLPDDPLHKYMAMETVREVLSRG